MFLEVACFSKESALIAAKAGADRIEFCENMDLGGTTPSIVDFKQVKQNTTIPVYVMIRPRGDNFTYTDEEFRLMQESLVSFKDAGADGFVFGALTKELNVDKTICAKLLSLAGGLPCTFHRAIDKVVSIEKSIEEVIDLGFSTVLSSGGADNVLAGIETLTLLQQKYGERIKLMPGGGVRSNNLSFIKEYLQTEWVHSSGILNGLLPDICEIYKIKKILASYL